MTRHRAIFLPGGVLPVGPAYGRLLEIMGDNVDARAKELEIYATPNPPAEYSLAIEVAGIARMADEAGFDRSHLVGYSAGGAASLAFAAAYPDRLLSLALMEPAFAGWQRMGTPERMTMDAFRDLQNLDGPELLARFQALQLAPGVPPMPAIAGPPPDWMASRPAAVKAILAAFMTGDLDLDALGAFIRPVWFAFGGRSNPDYYGLMATRLAAAFPDFTVELFPDRHHFDPPHRIEPARVAESLRSLWARAEPALADD